MGRPSMHLPALTHTFGSETIINLEAENTERSKQLVQLFESPPQNGRSDGYSLRKSLAWDSEFLTSEGVLNSEELAIINSTYSKAIGVKSPGIHEELRKFSDSTTTLNSEYQALEYLEVHLFENARASSKRLLFESNQTANMELSGKAKEQRNLDKPYLRSLKKLGISTQIKVASGHGHSRPSHKPPEISSANPSRAIQGKSSSLVVNKQTKNNRGKVLLGMTAKQQASLVLNIANNDSSTASRSIPSKESSLSTPQSGFKLISASCSSSSHPAGSSLDSSSPRLAIMRSSTRSTNCSSSSFSSYIPSKTTKNRTNQICNSSLGKSTSLLSKTSPSSSIDNVLLESSSHSSTSTEHSNSLNGSIDGLLSSPPSIPVYTDNGASQKSGGALSQSFTGNHSKITLKFGSDTKGTTSLGLRMPRPRVGYFDKENTQLHGSNRYLLTCMRSSLAKSDGISDTSAANRSELINPPSIRSGAHPYSPNQASKFTEAERVLRTLDKYQVVAPQVKKESSPKASEGRCKRNLKNKIEHSNPLQPKHTVSENEIHETGEQKRTKDQSFLINIQQEYLQSELNTVSGTEKENLCLESTIKCQSKALRTEEQCNTVPMCSLDKHFCTSQL